MGVEPPLSARWNEPKDATQLMAWTTMSAARASRVSSALSRTMVSPGSRGGVGMRGDGRSVDDFGALAWPAAAPSGSDDAAAEGRLVVQGGADGVGEGAGGGAEC